MMSGLDRSRGCIIRTHPAGYRVAMYYDAPGEYYDERGGEVTEALAEQAGFDTADLRRQRIKQQKLMEARQQIEREFATTEQDTAALLSTEGEVEVKPVAKGKYALFDASSGERLTTRDMTKQQATEFLTAMRGQEESTATSAPTKTDGEA